MSETRDERAGRLLRLGLDVAVRLRDGEEPAEVRTGLDALDYAELRDAVMLLAGCIDVSRPVAELVWWTEEPLTALPAKTRRQRPDCGTSAGYRCHLDRGESVDVACESAYLRDESERKRVHRTSPVKRSRETKAAGTIHSDREGAAA